MFKIGKISYIGNKQTNKYSNNVQIYVNPFFTDRDILTIIDLRDKKQVSNIKIFDRDQIAVRRSNVGHYTYYRILSSIFSKHTGQFCLLAPVSNSIVQDITKKSVGIMDKYLLISNNKHKEPVLMVVLNSRCLEELYYG